MVMTEGTWQKIMMQKYIAPRSCLEWVRDTHKSYTCTSLALTTMVEDFLPIVDHLVWRIKNRGQVLVGVDPWIGGIGYLI